MITAEDILNMNFYKKEKFTGSYKGMRYLVKKEKYRFTKAKEKYKAEHESELRRFYMVKRKLKEKGFEKEPFPLDAWQKEFSELSALREDEYQKYKVMQKDLTLLYQIKGDVDKVMRETHPEMLHTDKTKETTL